MNFSAEECTLVGERRPNGQLASVNSSFINSAVEKSTGYDITVRADREFSFGDLSVDILAARLLAYQYGLGDEKPTNYAGRHAYASWRGEADVRFNWRDFTVAWTMDYIGSTDEEPVYDLSRRREQLPAYPAPSDKIFHNLSFRYRDPKRRYSTWWSGYATSSMRSPPVVGWGQASVRPNLNECQPTISPWAPATASLTAGFSPRSATDLSVSFLKNEQKGEMHWFKVFSCNCRHPGECQHPAKHCLTLPPLPAASRGT